MTRSLPHAVRNDRLATGGREAWLIDEIPCAAGDRFEVRVESVGNEWRHGVWLGVDGLLEVDGEQCSQIVLWSDTAPETVDVDVVASSDRSMRIYNVWDSGRGIRPHESQKATTGMLCEDLADGRRYRCSSIAVEPAFDHLVFVITGPRRDGSG